MNHRPRHHNIINIMDEPVELCIEGSFTSFGFGVDVGAEVLDVEGTKTAVGEVEDGVAVDVEDLGRMSGGVDTFVVATIDTATHPEDLMWPSHGGIQHV